MNMNTKVFDAGWVASWTVLGLIASAFMYFVKASSVVATRPELEDIGFWTAFFSGRFESWLWYHYPAPAFIATMLFFTLGIGVGGVWWLKR